MRIVDYLDLPDRPDLDAFITRLDDDADRVRQNLRQFVVTEKMKGDLGDLLSSVGDRLASGKDVGRFIYGSFGSGKSHLLTVLGKMLESDEQVYDLGHPALRWLRGQHAWLDAKKTLVIRLNMMGKESLVSALYDAFNTALPEGVPPLVFTDDQRIFDLIDLDAKRFGGMEKLLESAVDEGAFEDVVGMPPGLPTPMLIDYVQRVRTSGSRKQRLGLAAALQTWRNHGGEPVRPQDLWVDAKKGFALLAQHAKDHGFAAVAWLVDELVIWIREKDRATYIKQVNDLSSMVDHDAARALPFLVAVAVQMDIAETCPDDISEKGFREQLGFISNRFQPALHLEEQDLFEVCAQRVLARRSTLQPGERQAFNDAIDAVLRKHEASVRGLSGNLDPGLVKRLYPFQPALLRVLVDVTQGLSRNRTAMAVLYGLLHDRADLQVGQFVPLGSLWPILFSADNVQALRRNARSALAQKLADAAETWERLEGKVVAVSQDQNAKEGELQQLTRSVLLCQLSEKPWFPDGRALKEAITASTLLALNRSEVQALTERTGVGKVAKYFRTLSGTAPQVHVIGDPADPHVEIKTTAVDLEKVLAEARQAVGHPQRFAYIRQLLIEQLDLPLGSATLGKHKVNWRGTVRSGEVQVVNVRTLTYAGRTNQFAHGDNDFLVLVDYPFDEKPDRGRQDDIETINNARSRSTHWTVSWLPTHFSATEMDALNNAAAVDLIRQDKRTYLQHYSPKEANEIARALETYQGGRRVELEEALRRLYFAEGEVHTLKSVLDGVSLTGTDQRKALEHLAIHVLDKRFPNHPTFGRRVGKAELLQLAEIVVPAAVSGQKDDLRAQHMALVDAVAVPLELVYKGASSVTPRRDGRYLGPVLEWVGNRQRLEAHELRDKLMAEDGWSFGFTTQLADFFLYYLLQVEGYEAQVDGQGLTVTGPTDLPPRFVLLKDEVVDAPTWDHAQGAARHLLGLKARADLPTSPEQAKLARDVRTAASDLGRKVGGLLGTLDAVLGWSGVAAADSRRRATVADLKAFLAGLGAATGNAGCVRQLATFESHAAHARWLKLVRELGKETEAADKIGDQRFTYEQVRDRADAPAQEQVVGRLAHLLTDDVDTSLLRLGADGWVAALQEHFRRLYPPTKPKPGAKTVEVAEVAVAGASARAAEVVGQALEGMDVAKVRLRITVEPLS
jgi:hypothetical protein